MSNKENIQLIRNCTPDTKQRYYYLQYKTNIIQFCREKILLLLKKIVKITCYDIDSPIHQFLKNKLKLLVKDDHLYIDLSLENDHYSDKLIKKIKKLNLKARSKVDINKIKKAIFYAKKYHGNQKRQSGEPYYSHPIEVAYMVTDYCFQTDILITSILHDTIEDTTLTKDIIALEFGSNIANQVECLTRNKLHGKLTAKEIIEPLYLQKKKELLLVKNLDRLHNIRTISVKSSEKQYQIILETLAIFVPLAKYLQMPKVEKELTKLCMITLDSLFINYYRTVNK